jgi:hypothetical protein
VKGTLLNPITRFTNGWLHLIEKWKKKTVHTTQIHKKDQKVLKPMTNNGNGQACMDQILAHPNIPLDLSKVWLA